MASEVIYALLGGILPALIWLLFWLREDKMAPEPRRLLLKTFLFGMGAVLLITVGALILEDRANQVIQNATLSTLLWLAALEEILKFGAAYFGGLRSREDNEPIDPIIYMITAALGFVALENALFIFGPIIQGEITQSVITGQMRFIGASLLHVVSSGLVGVALSFSFYKSRLIKVAVGALALLGAIAFHTFFNLMITLFKEAGTTWSALIVWSGVIFLLWAFEKAKTIAR